MHRRGKVLAAAAAMAVILGGALGASASRGLWAPAHAEGGTASGSLPNACTPSAESRLRTTEIATAKLIIEYNSTDDDLGVHGAFETTVGRHCACSIPTGSLVPPTTCTCRRT